MGRGSARRLVGAGLIAACLVGCGGDGSSPEVTFTDIEAVLPGVTAGCLAWGDYDGDGDLDLALAGGVGGGVFISRIYRNEGGVFNDIGAGLTGVCYSSLAWGDYDGDGDLDLALAGFIGGGNYVGKIYRNDGGGTFADISAPLAPAGWDSTLGWGDYDNDGDLDLAVAGWETGEVYRNDGGNVFTGVAAAWGNVSAAGWQTLGWGDYDNDGDLDITLSGYIGDSDPHGAVSAIYQNDGGTFADIGAGLTAVYDSSLAWGDYDNDGNLDLALTGGVGEGWPAGEVYRNESGTFVGVWTPPDVGGMHRPLAWGDCDNDGDLDLVIDFDIYRNDGQGVFVDSGAELSSGSLCAVAWGDYEGDGDLDLAVAGSTTKVCRNDGGVTNTPPSAPMGLSMSVSGGDVTFSWNAATDAETPALGLTYNLRVGTAANKEDVMPGMSVIGGANDGWRLIPAMGSVQHNTSWTLKGLSPGDYYWSVQAVDTAFCASPWAPEQMVTVP